VTRQLNVPVAPGRPTFLLSPACDDLAALDADVAVLGVPHGVPYDMANMQGPSADAPRAVREQSVRYAGEVRASWDFTFGGTLFNGAPVRIADCGDVLMLPGDHAGNSARATAAVAAILDRGAFPLVLGGDHSIPIPVMRAYEGRGSLFDAHIDWRDEVRGERWGLSSTMRRCSEMPHVGTMVQFGRRGV